MRSRGVFRIFLFFGSLCLCGFLFAAENLLFEANFETGDLSGWRTSGDVCIAPSFCAGKPSGNYWIGMSTNQGADPITLCGSSSMQGVQSILRSPNLLLPFKPSRIRIDFSLKFLTSEDHKSDLGTDLLTVRLLTTAGSVVIASFDDAGPSPESMNLRIQGDSKFRESSCNPTWKYETGLLQVSYYRTFREPVISQMYAGPVALEFALNNEFDTDFDSAVVIDDIRITVYPVGR